VAGILVYDDSKRNRFIFFKLRPLSYGQMHNADDQDLDFWLSVDCFRQTAGEGL